MTHAPVVVFGTRSTALRAIGGGLARDVALVEFPPQRCFVLPGSVEFGDPVAEATNKIHRRVAVEP